LDPFPTSSSSQKKQIATVISLLISIALLAATFIFALQTSDLSVMDMEQLVDGRPGPLALAGLALIGVMTVNGVILRDLAGHFGVCVKARDWLGVTFVGSLLNLVSPVKGSVAARAIYLKHLYALSYIQYASMQAASLMFSLSISGAMALVSLCALGIPGGRAGEAAVLFSILATLSMPVVLILAPSVEEPKIRALKAVKRIYDGWVSVRSNRWLIVRLTGWSTLGAVLHAIAFVKIFSFVGLSETALVAVAASSFARIGTLVAITPAGLGIFEAFSVVSATIAGADSGAALAATIVLRLITSICAIAAGAVFLPVIAYRYRSA
jgi:uncharacterized membrane protein YbhN (UPF0104 family)